MAKISAQQRRDTADEDPTALSYMQLKKWMLAKGVDKKKEHTAARCAPLST